jgi:hypothetical protein
LIINQGAKIICLEQFLKKFRRFYCAKLADI